MSTITNRAASSDNPPFPWRTRGSFDPNENATQLPLQSDCTIGIDVAMTNYDSFIVADNGVVPAGVSTPDGSLNVVRGDRLVLNNGDPSVASSWLIVRGNLAVASTGQGPGGDITNTGVRVIGSKHPGFIFS